MISIDNIITIAGSIMVAAIGYGMLKQRVSNLESRMDSEIQDIETGVADMKLEIKNDHLILVASQKESESNLFKAVEKMTDSNHKVEISIVQVASRLEHMSNNLKQSQYAREYLEGKRE